METEESDISKEEAEVKRLEDLASRKKKALDDLESLKQREALAGKSIAAPPVVKKEETPKEYKDRMEGYVRG